MNTKEYLENKARKRKAYKDHNLPLIEIEREEYKDSLGLRTRLLRELNALAKEHFRISDFFK